LYSPTFRRTGLGNGVSPRASPSRRTEVQDVLDLGLLVLGHLGSSLLEVELELLLGLHELVERLVGDADVEPDLPVRVLLVAGLELHEGRRVVALLVKDRSLLEVLLGGLLVGLRLRRCGDEKKQTEESSENVDEKYSHFDGLHDTAMSLRTEEYNHTLLAANFKGLQDRRDTAARPGLVNLRRANRPSR
jgi:hypothetical protein